MLKVVLAIQVSSFFALGAIFLSQGQWRLGTVQLLLAIIQGVLYSGKMQ